VPPASYPVDNTMKIKKDNFDKDDGDHSLRSTGRTWLGPGDATWFGGGRTTLNGALSNDLQQNSRVGATLAFPVDRYNSIKFALSSGVSARTGNSFDLIALAWQHRWGDGL